MAAVKKKSSRPITEDRFRDIIKETVPPIVENIIDSKFKAYGMHSEKQMQEIVSFVQNLDNGWQFTKKALAKILFGIKIMTIISLTSALLLWIASAEGGL